MFSLKVAQDPRLHFRRKKFPKKKYFSSLIPYISELRPNTGSMFSQIVQAFYRLHFGLKTTSKFFSYWMFSGKKEDENFFEKIFLIRSSYFSKLIKDTESMTPSIFCQKNFDFFQKNFLGLFYLSSYISRPRPNMGFMVSLISRGLCRLRFRLNVMSNFFFALCFS